VQRDVYGRDSGVRLASLDSTDLLVTGPNGYSNLVEFVGADLPMDGSPLTATYSIPAPGDFWDAADNGTYTVTLLEEARSKTRSTTPLRKPSLALSMSPSRPARRASSRSTRWTA
jgi:hypothetical protein